MTKTFRVGLHLTKDDSFTFRTSDVISREHLVRNLKRMMSNGRIKGWKIYDNRAADMEWERDTTLGSF